MTSAFPYLTLILASPLGRNLFRFGQLHGDDVLLVAAVVVCVVVVLKGLRRFWHARPAR